MVKGIKIVCCNCNNSIAFLYSTSKINEIVSSGWGSNDDKLYCPECFKKVEQNNEQCISKENIIRVIDEIAAKQ